MPTNPIVVPFRLPTQAGDLPRGNGDVDLRLGTDPSQTQGDSTIEDVAGLHGPDRPRGKRRCNIMVEYLGNGIYRVTYPPNGMEGERVVYTSNLHDLGMGDVMSNGKKLSGDGFFDDLGVATVIAPDRPLKIENFDYNNDGFENLHNLGVEEVVFNDSGIDFGSGDVSAASGGETMAENAFETGFFGVSESVGNIHYRRKQWDSDIINENPPQTPAQKFAAELAENRHFEQKGCSPGSGDYDRP